jgi:hypothetical protein
MENAIARSFAGFCLRAENIPVPERDTCKVTIPHVIYNDNPSAAPSGLFAHIGKKKERARF